MLLLSLSALARPLDPTDFMSLEPLPVELMGTGVIDNGLGTMTLGPVVYYGVLSEEGSWVFTFNGLTLSGDLTITSPLPGRPVAILSRGDLTLGGTLDGTGGGFGPRRGPGRPAEEREGASFAGLGSGQVDRSYGDLVRRLDQGSGDSSVPEAMVGGGGAAVELGAVGVVRIDGTVDLGGLWGSGGGLLVHGPFGSNCFGHILVDGSPGLFSNPSSGGRVVLLGLDTTACTIDGFGGTAPLNGSRIESVDGDGDHWPFTHDPDDTNASVFPGAPEFCDGIDNDLDGWIDEPSGLQQSGYVMHKAVLDDLASYPNGAPQVWGGRLDFPDPQHFLYRAEEAVPAGVAGTARLVKVSLEHRSVSPEITLVAGSSVLNFAFGPGGAVATPGVDQGTDFAAGSGAVTEAALPSDGRLKLVVALNGSQVQATAENAAGETRSWSLPSTLSVDDPMDVVLGAGDGATIDWFAVEAFDDLDGDGVNDACDNCVQDPNPDQADQEGDGFGDVCDVCPDGPDRTDSDGDGIADGCDACPFDDPDDTDGDGVCDNDDACLGDDGTNDFDGDGVCGNLDACEGSDDALDEDLDGVPDGCDLCVFLADPDQLDTDGDGQGDACDPCPLDNPDDPDVDGLCGCLDIDDDGFCGDVDCDDLDPAIFPGAVEVCDGRDNSCAGFLVPGEADLDGDGFGICQGDCDDGDATRNPDAMELCNLLDDNCDGVVDDGLDGDGDGVASCVDCDDGDAEVFPGAVEVCEDGRDNDCSGTDALCDSGEVFVDDQGGCRCDAGSGAGWWLGLAMVALCRRQRMTR